jgi:hypothetical protein
MLAALENQHGDGGDDQDDGGGQAQGQPVALPRAGGRNKLGTRAHERILHPFGKDLCGIPRSCNVDTLFRHWPIGFGAQEFYPGLHLLLDLPGGNEPSKDASARNGAQCRCVSFPRGKERQICDAILSPIRIPFSAGTQRRPRAIPESRIQGLSGLDRGGYAGAAGQPLGVLKSGCARQAGVRQT